MNAADLMSAKMEAKFITNYIEIDRELQKDVMEILSIKNTSKAQSNGQPGIHAIYAERFAKVCCGKNEMTYSN